MGFLDALTHIFSDGSRFSPEAMAAADALRKQMRARCRHFRRLLAANKEALEIMADMEERLTPRAGGKARPFDMGYVRSSTSRVVTAVHRMVTNLNALSDRAYDGLREPFSRIAHDISALIGTPPPSFDGPTVLPLSEIRAADMPRVGGKMAQLGEIAAKTGLPVPEGFAVTAAAYQHFMQANNLTGAVEQRLRETDGGDLNTLFELSRDIRQRIFMSAVPADLKAAITEALTPLRLKYGDRLRLALRSSAVGEDAKDASFAGQFDTQLGIHPDDVIDVWREIVASKYNVASMSYRHTRGIPDESVPMCVGVIVMVDAVAGGVAYSRDPADPNGNIVINAVPGLPKTVVDGSYTPDAFACSHEDEPRILERTVADKPWKLVRGEQGDNEQIPLTDAERTAPALSDEQLREVAEAALRLEKHYGRPQDMEWAFNREEGRLIILQSRDISAVPQVASSAAEDPRPDLEILARGGVNTSMGAGMGPVYIARTEADMPTFPQGAVLVVEHSLPCWAALLPRAAALVTERGGIAGHLASVAREYGLPALFGVPNATEVLQKDQPVTVHCAARCVYRGLHEQIAPPAPAKNPMQGSPVLAALESVAPYITPLHLLDPESPDFSPEGCTSLHDITRFCHEKSVSLLFEQDDSTTVTYGKQLKVGKKLQYWIMDMDEGLSPDVTGSTVELKDIRSEPMLAVWEGMTFSPWEGPPSTNASGFMSIVMESTMNRDLEATAESKFVQKNFFIIGRNYVNLQARFGYHFCTVDANVTDNDHENYVSFQFKGGAASIERRIARARLVERVLSMRGFKCDVRSDALFAIAEAGDKHLSLRRTAILGHLLIHTRQIDMVMHNPQAVQRIEEKLLRETEALMHRE